MILESIPRPSKHLQIRRLVPGFRSQPIHPAGAAHHDPLAERPHPAVVGGAVCERLWHGWAGRVPFRKHGEITVKDIGWYMIVILSHHYNKLISKYNCLGVSINGGYPKMVGLFQGKPLSTNGWWNGVPLFLWNDGTCPEKTRGF